MLYTPYTPSAAGGHGIGKMFHTNPNILHYRNNESNGIMKVGHTFTIEPMICEGTGETLHVCTLARSSLPHPPPAPLHLGSRWLLKRTFQAGFVAFHFSGDTRARGSFSHSVNNLATPEFFFSEYDV